MYNNRTKFHHAFDTCNSQALHFFIELLFKKKKLEFPEFTKNLTDSRNLTVETRVALGR